MRQSERKENKKRPAENPGPRLLKGVRKTTLLIPFLGVAALFFAGCSVVGPEYHPPEIASPEAWHTPLEDGLSSESADPESLREWWTVLEDSLLDSLIDRAVAGNLSLREAQSRVLEARALRGIQAAALMPEADAGASAAKSRTSSNVGGGNQGELYSLGFDAGWELDVFGGKQRAVESAQADLEAVTADLNDVLVSLTAEVALNYLDVRIAQARLVSAMTGIENQEKTLELNRSRFTAGLIHELAVRQSLYNLEHTRSQVPALKASLATAGNRLAVLLGISPGALENELIDVKPVPVPPPMITVGVPAEMLRRRPDIRRAERNLAARTADIGVATADLYPKFRLFGSIGLESLALEDLPEWASRYWGFGPSVSWKLFDAGAVKQNIAVKNARQEQALIQYQAAVLNAREEVENILIAYVREQDRRDALSRAVEAARQAESLALDRYRIGVVGFTDVLEAQRSLLAFQDELEVSNGQVTANLIRLYKALGGGWESMSDRRRMMH